MPELTKAITKEIGCRPEGAPITAAAFLHLGNRPAVSQALRALAKGGVILRAAHEVYLAPVVSRFGRHAPHAHLFIYQLAAQSGEAIAPFGAACANVLGLTTQDTPDPQTALAADRPSKDQSTGRVAKGTPWQ